MNSRRIPGVRGILPVLVGLPSAPGGQVRPDEVGHWTPGCLSVGGSLQGVAGVSAAAAAGGPARGLLAWDAEGGHGGDEGIAAGGHPRK